jgi:methylmalonyl-CoA/ethylmalonyl-CoA epimerase
VITGFSHVSIVVPSLEDAAVHLKRVYGLELGEVKLNAEQGVRLAYVELGNARIELMEPSGAESPVARFLERNPRGAIHHFCLAVDDVDATTREIGARGGQVLGQGGAQRNVHGERIAFVHPKDFLGALVELEEEKP